MGDVQERRVATLPSQARKRVQTAIAVSRGSLGRRDSAAVFLTATVAYLVTFLWAIQDLVLRPGAGVGVATVVSEPFARMFETSGPYTFEPIALLEIGVGTLQFSPLNTLLGAFIAALVGLNLALTYLAWTQPKSCGIGATSGLLASIPALLAGSACCAPVILVVVGIQASALLLSVFAVLLPASILLLLGSLVYVADMVDPTAV